MRRLIVILASIILCVSSIYGQGGRKILYRADMGYYDEEAYPGAQRLIGNVKFKQDNIIGYCDSAYLYEADNYLIAYGSPVRFVISDSIRLFGLRATYDGNIRQASIVGSKVRLENGKSYLLSDSLFYDLNIDCGSYITGGQIFNDADTLTSQIGKYYTNTDDAYLHENVLLRSSSYQMDCDSLRYNAASKIAYFISPTHLVNEENTIFTDRGLYNTDADIDAFLAALRRTATML